MAPRYGAYKKGRPPAAGWEWRSLSLEAPNGRQYRILFDVSPGRGKWKAMLIRVGSDGVPVALIRFEDQPGRHGGLHIHANCGDEAYLAGAESIDMQYTLPDHGRTRRRRFAWTKALFCMAAAKFFRTDPLNDQEEFPV